MPRRKRQWPRGPGPPVPTVVYKVQYSSPARCHGTWACRACWVPATLPRWWTSGLVDRVDGTSGLQGPRCFESKYRRHRHGRHGHGRHGHGFPFSTLIWLPMSLLCRDQHGLFPPSASLPVCHSATLPLSPPASQLPKSHPDCRPCMSHLTQP